MLTPRQQEVYDYVLRHQAEHGLIPTQAEIAEVFGFTRLAARQHLQLIAKKGYLEIPEGKPRAMRTRDRLAPLGQLPVLGRVAAGPPVLATDSGDEALPIPPSLFHPAPDYLLRVTGSSMIEAGIRDGDLVAIKQVEAAENGQIVVARIPGKSGAEVTLKRYERRDGSVVLHPYNATLTPIVIPVSESDPGDQSEPAIEIAGLYCGHIRTRGA